MVEQRTLTPHILVRVQVSQPIKNTGLYGRFFVGLWVPDEDQSSANEGGYMPEVRDVQRTVQASAQDKSCLRPIYNPGIPAN